MVEYVDVADMDVPAGSGGINRERYTYGELRRRPIIPEVMRGISDSVVRRWAEECNARNRSGFVMRKVNGEYRFDGLHVGSKVKLPSKGGLLAQLGPDPSAQAVREVSYALLREEIARQTGCPTGPTSGSGTAGTSASSWERNRLHVCGSRKSSLQYNAYYNTASATSHSGCSRCCYMLRLQDEVELIHSIYAIQ